MRNLFPVLVGSSGMVLRIRQEKHVRNADSANETRLIRVPISAEITFAAVICAEQ